MSGGQAAYIRDFIRLDRKKRSTQRQQGFEEFRNNFFTVMASGDFTSGFPRVSYNPATERYGIAIRLGTKPNFKLLIGGNISSTAFNQAFIGFDYQTVGRVAQSLYGGLYLGPLYSTGSFGGRTDFYGNPSFWITPTTSRSRVSATATSATSPRWTTRGRSKAAKVSFRQPSAFRFRTAAFSRSGSMQDTSTTATTSTGRKTSPT